MTCSAPRGGGNLAEGEGIEPPVALASARQFSGLVTLPTRPPLCTIWRTRHDSNPFASLRASLVRERRLELPRRRRRCLGPLWLPVSPLAQNWCADRDWDPD